MEHKQFVFEIGCSRHKMSVVGVVHGVVYYTESIMASKSVSSALPADVSADFSSFKSFIRLWTFEWSDFCRFFIERATGLGNHESQWADPMMYKTNLCIDGFYIFGTLRRRNTWFTRCLIVFQDWKGDFVAAISTAWISHNGSHCSYFLFKVTPFCWISCRVLVSCTFSTK